MKRALPILAATAIAVLVALGAGNYWTRMTAPQHTSPTASSTSAELLLEAGLADEIDGRIVVDAAATLDVLEQIPTGGTTTADYDRDQFGQRWADTDRNGCDTRNDILRRDLVDVGLKPGTNDCVVLTGTLHDAYTGQDITFQRGQGTSELVQIDHLWSLSGSWYAGADLWTADKREQFANDPANLEAVDGPSNSAKGDSGPSQWLPANADYLCTYAARLTFVASKYQLPLFAEDRLSITHILERCS